MRLLLIAVASSAVSAAVSRFQELTLASRPVWDGTTVEDLWNEYYNIFPTSNRNAAAFKWSTFLLERSWQMSPETFEHLATGYCAVAAAIVKAQGSTRYSLQLPVIGGGVKKGLMYYCCWPCICDTLDFLNVDTKTVQLRGGQTRQYHFAVMGDPCKNPASLTTPYTDPFSGEVTTMSQQAPEVQCNADGSLRGATKSDNGHIIMAMFFEDHGQSSQLQTYYEGFAGSPCEKRAESGYRSGMGLVFRKVAGASPIAAYVALPHSVEKNASSTALRIASPASALVHQPKNLLTCPNGQSGVTTQDVKAIANVSRIQLVRS